MDSIAYRLPASIATARLVLRAPVLDDLDDLVLLANNWKIAGPTAIMPFPYGQADGRAFLTSFDDPVRPLAYAITALEQKLMGVVSLKFEPAKPVELGYWLGEPFWGRGFVPEAVGGLLDACAVIDGLRVIWARALESNVQSVRVLHKAGFNVIERTTSVVERHFGKPVLILEWRAP